MKIRESKSNFEMIYLVNQRSNDIASAIQLFFCAATEMNRCDKVGELMVERQLKDRREQNKVRLETTRIIIAIILFTDAGGV